MVGFIFGGNTGDSYESLQRRRQVADRFAAQLMANKPKTALEGVAAVLAGLGGSINRGRIDDAENAGTDKAKSFADAILSGSPLGGSSTASQVSATSPNQPYTTAGGGATQSAGPINMDGNQIYSGFIDTVKQGGLTNPYGLAAVAATGKAESGFSPQNANRSWSDPSQSGQAGSAGGIMSWRADRLKNLYGYASSKGEKPGAISPQTQAEFFLREDPTLIQKLNAAKSPEEAQSMMNRAWAFAGYDKPGGESARRLSYANSFLPTFQGNQQAQAQPQQQAPQAPQEVASLDPSVGMSGAGSEMMRTNPAPEARAAAPSIAAPNIPIPTPRPQMQAPDVSGPAPQSEGPSVEVAGGGGRPSSYAQPQAPQGNGVDPRILQALANPFTPPEMKQSLQMLAQQQMQQAQQQQEQQTWMQRQNYEQQQRQADPGYQMGLRVNQAKLEEMQQPGYQVLSQEERQQLGIPTNDQRVYQKSRDGKIDAVGGQGQTINVGNEVEARKSAAAQAGLQPDDPAYQGFILTGKLPRENEQNLTATDKKAILEADEMVQGAQSVMPLLDRALELNDKAYSGPTAGIRGMVAGAVGSDAGEATQELDNVVTAGALTQLKAIFGGAPTEGERSILLDMSGASSKPAEVRRGIYERAKQAAQRRLGFYQKRADDLRGSTFYKPATEAAQPPGPSGQQQSPASAPQEVDNSAVPAGVNPELWKYMPPEDRALWK